MDNEFDLERFKAGEPAYTENCEEAYFIAYDDKLANPLIVRRGERSFEYSMKGKSVFHATSDLKMKPMIKQIDWNKLPVDTCITLYTGSRVRYFSSFSDGMINFYRDGTTSKTTQSDSSTLKISPCDMQISPEQPWNVWNGGNCPIPDGLEFEYMIHEEPGQVMTNKEIASAYLWQPRLIYAYRLTGCLLEGWKHA